MRIGLLCATRRGYRVLETLIALLPEARLVVFSFREQPGEPPFMDDIRALTLAHGGEFVEVRQLGGRRWERIWAAAPIDLLLVVSWRYMVPAEVYSRPWLGTFVFHDSLLPAYRGFGPTVWAIVNGEDHTGVTLFAIAAEVDAGEIVAQQRVPIGPDETIAEVLERVTERYLDLLTRYLPRLLAGDAPRVAQDHARATFTCRRLPEDNRIDWSAPTTAIYNLVRAVTAPYGGAFTTLDGQRLIVWAARPLQPARRYVGRVAGRVVEIRPGEGTVVLTGDGALLVTRVQLDGQEPVCAAEILNSVSQTLGR